MTYRRNMGAAIPPIQPISDSWYQAKARELQTIAAATAGIGQVEPPPPGAPKYALMIGWGAVIAITAGIFYAATQGVGTKSVQANRRRRRSSRLRRNTSRRRHASPFLPFRVNTRRTAKKRSLKVGLSPKIVASLSRSAAGLYRVGKGKVTKYKAGVSLQGAMTSTRIAASASGEAHWLVRVKRSGSPKVVVVRKMDGAGKTIYRAA
jgi:hypothetical protein